MKESLNNLTKNSPRDQKRLKVAKLSRHPFCLAPKYRIWGNCGRSKAPRLGTGSPRPSAKTPALRSCPAPCNGSCGSRTGTWRCGRYAPPLPVPRHVFYSAFAARPRASGFAWPCPAPPSRHRLAEQTV